MYSKFLEQCIVGAQEILVQCMNKWLQMPEIRGQDQYQSPKRQLRAKEGPKVKALGMVGGRMG